MKALNIIKCDSSCTQETLLYNPYKFQENSPTQHPATFYLKKKENKRNERKSTAKGLFSLFKSMAHLTLSKGSPSTVAKKKEVKFKILYK